MTGAVMTRALVTGAGRRIGQALAIALGQAGYHVLAHYHASAQGVAETVANIRAQGGQADAVCCDLSDQAAVEALIPGLAKTYGPIDILVNSAASFFNDDISRLESQTFDRQIQINLKAPSFLCAGFAAQAPEGSAIINVLDNKIAALDPGFLSYGLTKVAMGGLTRMLSLALAPKIRVNGLAPGLTLISGKQSQETFDRHHRATPLGRGADLEDLTAGLLYLIGAKAVTGQILVVDGGRFLDGPLGPDFYAVEAE
jgi:NAD(P)-dependent dehydrogenase (short-subunit alcohol dehydrogenase family)